MIKFGFKTKKTVTVTIAMILTAVKISNKISDRFFLKAKQNSLFLQSCIIIVYYTNEEKIGFYL